MNVMADDIKFKNMVESRDFESTIQSLRSKDGGQLVNSDLAFFQGDMTGLEFAICGRQWRMAAIFFIFGADPQKNVFDGFLHTQAAHFGFGGPDVIPGFEGNPVPGFEGLYLLIDEEDAAGNAYIWLFQSLFECKSTSIVQNMRELYAKLDDVSHDLQFTGNDCKEYVLTMLLCMKQLGVPNDVALRVAEDGLLGELWGLVEAFALGGVREVSGEVDE